MTAGIDPVRLSALFERESAAFHRARPRSATALAWARGVMPDGVPMAWMAGLYAHAPIFVTGGQGSRFQDVDGQSYNDFNLADLSNSIGYGENPVSRRVAEQAARGLQYLLPTEDAICVSEELARRTGAPFWQFTATASGANTEVIRIARAFTGRAKVVVFEGKYHGHLDTTLVENGQPEAMGITEGAVKDSIVVPFNDAQALADVLALGDVALVLTEPALTNCTLVLPDPGYLDEVRQLCAAHGALLCIDETHSWQFAFGGLTAAMGLQADFLTVGKGLGTGVPWAAYGMSAELARYLEANRDYSSHDRRGLAIGGTTYGNALTMAAVRAGLEQMQTAADYARTAELGSRLAGGIAALIAQHGLPWQTFHYGPRSGFCLTAELPRNYSQTHASMDLEFSAARRIFMANRGIWDAICSAGPQVSFAQDAEGVDRYLAVAAEFLAEVTLPN